MQIKGEKKTDCGIYSPGAYCDGHDLSFFLGGQCPVIITEYECKRDQIVIRA